MVTFTLPEQLRFLCHYRPQRFYGIFFACAAQAIKDVLSQKRHLGAQAGFFGILQTWTQDLRLHPHIHFVVPAIGIDLKGTIKRPCNHQWLARGDVFASRLRTLMLKEFQGKDMIEHDLMHRLWTLDWNCDVKNFGRGDNAMKYLGAYLFKGPIGDSRIPGCDEQSVRIALKDRESKESFHLTIEGIEFVRRYL